MKFLEYITRPHHLSDWYSTIPRHRYCQNCYRVISETGTDYDILPMSYYSGIILLARCDKWKPKSDTRTGGSHEPTN